NVVLLVRDDAATDLLVRLSVEHRDESLRKAADQALSTRNARRRAGAPARSGAEPELFASEIVGYAGA
ncbi:MAG TPA: hypothetical protein VFL42_03995, partial [Terriglobales bacterium]|nr:hypothetical protein [Terriglobales bacterium]